MPWLFSMLDQVFSICLLNISNRILFELKNVLFSFFWTNSLIQNILSIETPHSLLVKASLISCFPSRKRSLLLWLRDLFLSYFASLIRLEYFELIRSLLELLSFEKKMKLIYSLKYLLFLFQFNIKECDMNKWKKAVLLIECNFAIQSSWRGIFLTRLISYPV